MSSRTAPSRSRSPRCVCWSRPSTETGSRGRLRAARRSGLAGSAAGVGSGDGLAGRAGRRRARATARPVPSSSGDSPVQPDRSSPSPPRRPAVRAWWSPYGGAPSASELADHHVQPGARPARLRRPRPSSRGRAGPRRAAPGMRGAAPDSRSSRTIRPLVALLKWLTTWRFPATSCRTRTVATRRASVAGGRQNAAYMLLRRSTTSRSPAASSSAGPSGVPPVRRRPRRGRAGRQSPGEAVRRDPVGRADDAEQARGHQQPGRRAAPGGGAQRGRRQGVVQHARSRRGRRAPSVRCGAGR